MATAADRIKAKEERREQRRAEGVTSSRSTQRTKYVRQSVDMDPADHAEFVQWAAGAGPQLGRSRIPTAEIIRLLIKRLMAEEGLQAKIIEDLRQAK